jgi:outer membrane protein OmpA-like peptidoglycan-associated protein/tetratricopeptide (TPR) repeat protein
MSHFTRDKHGYYILLALILIQGGELLGQKKTNPDNEFKIIRQYYDSGDLISAEKEALELVGKVPDYINGYLMLADIYKDKSDSEKETEVLIKAFPLSENPAVAIRLGNSAYSIGKYVIANEAYNKYILLKKNTGISAATSQKIRNTKFAIEALKSPVKFNPERLPSVINTEDDEYWPVVSIDGKRLIFTRLTAAGKQKSDEDFYVSVKDSGGWGKALPISEINTLNNEGAQSLSSDGNLLFFTLCGLNNGMGSCDIYYSRFENGNWGKPVNAGSPVNTAYWDAQPSLSSDGLILYFSSNRPGGKGQKDLWYVSVKGFDAEGKIVWGKAENAGDSINTTGDEISPFIHANRRNIYFASDNHTGMGGFDLFVSSIKKNRFSSPKNLGFPINSHKNEQGLYITPDGTRAFFATARDSRFKHDIYQFEMDETLKPIQATYINARVLDSETKNPLVADIEIYNITKPDTDKRIETTGKDGRILTSVTVGSNYALSISKDGYLFFSESIKLENVNTIYKPYKFEISLEPVKPNRKMELYNVFFETDSFRLLPESMPELNKLLLFLKNNPLLKIEIQGHTDNSGNSENNMTLSEKRAKTVAAYLTDNGIYIKRLTTAGYGDSQPVEPNLTPEGKQRNRRTTIKIVSVSQMDK